MIKDNLKTRPDTSFSQATRVEEGSRSSQRGVPAESARGSLSISLNTCSPFGTGFVYTRQIDIVKNLNEFDAKYGLGSKLIQILLGLGVVCFGFVFPDSLSDHNKLVHFSAHFGMSFLLALCFYVLCSIKLRIPKAISYTVLISATLIIGVIYKFWEISTQGMVGNYSLGIIIDRTGCLTSMSQNLSGLMAAMIVIENLLHKNLRTNLIHKPA